MNIQSTRYSLGLGAALLAGMQMLAGQAQAQERAASAPQPVVNRTPVFSVQLSDAVDREQRNDASYVGLGLTAQRTLFRPRVSLDITGASRLRVYHSGSSLVKDAQSVDNRLRVVVSPRTTLTATHRVSWLPTLNAPVASTAGVIPGLTTGASLGLARQWSRRTTGALTYRYDRVSFAGEDRVATSQGASGAISRTTRRNLMWQAAYDLSRALTTSPSNTSAFRTHAAGVQVKYNRPSAPETTLTIRLTPSFTRLHQTAATDGVERRAALVVAGMARIDHQVAASLRLGLSYERSMSSLDGYDQPIVSDALGGHADVRVRRLATVSTNVVVSRGTPGIYQTDGRARSVSASARLALRTSAASAVFVDYARSAFVVDGVLATGPTRKSFDRTTLRIGATLDLTPWHPSGWFRERQ